MDPRTLDPGVSNLRAIVIGGGMAGVSAGYYLALAGVGVTLLEREPVLAHHSTGRSAALYFENYGASINRLLTRASRPFLESPPARLVDQALMARRGALWVGRPDQIPSLQSIRDDSPDGHWLQPEQATAMVPVLRTEYLGGGVLEPEALDIDVAALHQGFVRGLRAAGGEIRISNPVIGLEANRNRWTVATSNDHLAADVVVNAAGAWAEVVGTQAGAPQIGLQPMRRTAFMVPGDLAYRSWPLVGDTDNEFYFRPDGGQLLCSLAEEKPSAPEDARPDELDIAVAIERINTATTLGIRSVRSSWTGLRSFVADRGIVIGFDQAAPGFFWVAGQGGTGIQTAPAAGRLAASLITTGEVPPDMADLGITAADTSPVRLQIDQTR